MKKKKHKPPSRIRYEKKNPVFSIRMPQEFHDEFKTLAEDLGLSRRELMAIFLKKQKANYHRAYMHGDKEGYRIGYNVGCEKGNTEGYKKGMNDWAIWGYCVNCGKAAYITPNSDIHMAIIEFLKERGFAHIKCHEQKNY